MKHPFHPALLAIALLVACSTPNRITPEQQAQVHAASEKSTKATDRYIALLSKQNAGGYVAPSELSAAESEASAALEEKSELVRRLYHHE